MQFRRLILLIPLFVIVIGCQQNSQMLVQEPPPSHDMNYGIMSTQTEDEQQLSHGEQKKPESNEALRAKYPNVIVSRGATDRMQLALTFDDGPDRTFTPQVLDVLKKHGVSATFFLMGSRAAALPDVTKRIADEGHIIGNHTYWHPKLYAESLERVHWELTETDKALQQITGQRPRLFRAPYGGLTSAIVEQLEKMEYSHIGWSVDSLDWKGLSKEEVMQNVMDQIHPGAIILMHSGGHWTQDLSGMVAALDELIPLLSEQGYEWVTIPDMLNIAATF